MEPGAINNINPMIKYQVKVRIIRERYQKKIKQN